MKTQFFLNVFAIILFEKRTADELTVLSQKCVGFLCVADFASCEVFAEWCQNVPKWAGNL